MEVFITQLPQSPIGWITLFGFSILTITQVVLTVRRNDIKVLRESNEDLRGRINDLEITVRTLTEKIDHLKGSNTFLTEVVQLALVSYFESNPSLTKIIKKEVKQLQKPETS